MTNQDLIVRNISDSPYLCEWIIALKNNDVLFNPSTNIKPCIHLDNNSFRSRQWQGLSILLKYVNSSFQNEEVDEYIVNLLNKSISLYLNDERKERYERLNSSDVIVLRLIEIALAKSIYINNVDVGALINEYFKSPLGWPYMVADCVFHNKNSIMGSNEEKISQIYKTIIDNSSERIDFENLMDVNDIIAEYPGCFYKLAKEKILSLKDNFYDMGSFFEYKNNHFHNIKNVVFNWIKESSVFLSDDFLVQEVDFFISKNSKLLKKVGLGLVNVNFKRMNQYFIDNISKFFKDPNFYGDIRSIFIRWSSEPILRTYKETLIESINNATFGDESEQRLFVLKNHLFGILKKNRFNVQYVEEKEDEIEFASNFNKAIYISSSRISNGDSEIYKSIQNLTIEEAISSYENYKNKSSFYKYSVNKAFSKYLVEKYPNNFDKYLENFDYSLSDELILYLDQNIPDDCDKILRLITAILENCRKDDSFKKCLRNVMFSIEDRLDKFPQEKIFKIIKLVDYKWIEIKEYDDIQNCVTTCINEPLYLYLDILSYICFKQSECLQALIDCIMYFLSNFNSHKTKSIVSFLVPRLKNLDKNIFNKIFDELFENNLNGKNLSFPLLTIDFQIDDELLGRFAKMDSFFQFLHTNYDGGDEQKAQSLFFNRIFQYYITKEGLLNLLNIVFENNNDEAIFDIIQSANFWMEEGKVDKKNINNIQIFFGNFLSYIDKFNDFKNYGEQYIKEISSTIIIMKNEWKFLWQILINLFRKHPYDLTEQTLRLIDKYQNNEYRNVCKILDSYFEGYTPWLTLDNDVIKILNLLKSNAKYVHKVKEWKVILYKKNIDLKTKLEKEGI